MGGKTPSSGRPLIRENLAKNISAVRGVIKNWKIFFTRIPSAEGGSTYGREPSNPEPHLATFREKNQI